MVGGRTVEVDLALSQDDARNLASGGRASSGPGKDNRNLYLVPAAPPPPVLTLGMLLHIPRLACKCKGFPLHSYLDHSVILARGARELHPVGSTPSLCAEVTISITDHGKCSM